MVTTAVRSETKAPDYQITRRSIPNDHSGEFINVFIYSSHWTLPWTKWSPHPHTLFLGDCLCYPSIYAHVYRVNSSLQVPDQVCMHFSYPCKFFTIHLFHSAAHNHYSNIRKGIKTLKLHHKINPLTPELNPSAQRCLTRFIPGDFASWTIHFVNICVKTQQIRQLFIQFINYVW
jgi:hypothetical protein